MFEHSKIYKPVIWFITSIFAVLAAALFDGWWDSFRGPLEAGQAINQLSDSPVTSATGLWWAQHGINLAWVFPVICAAVLISWTVWAFKQSKKKEESSEKSV